MNCCNNADKSEKGTDNENHEEKKISWKFIIIAIILIGLLFLSLIAM